MSAARDDGDPVRWRSRAACRDVDPELFFPAAEAGPQRDVQVAAAKAVCAGCPVRRECLAEALARIPYGIAGGLTEHERRRRRARTAACPVDKSDVDDVLIAGLRPSLTSKQRAGIGRALLADGHTPRQVARICQVTTRTAERWANRTQATTTTSASGVGEGSTGGHRAPLRTSHPHNPQPEARAAEGHQG